MSHEPCEMRAGMRVQFLNGDVDPEEGIVNGPPWVFFDGIDAVARVPVFSLTSNEVIDVAGHNIFRVRAEHPGYSVKA